MLQLTYISSITPGVSPDELERILLTSRRRNMSAGVTGLLVFDGKRFLQALEGNETEVRAAFARIAADPRHRAIVKLSQREVAQREFGDWAMASRISTMRSSEGSLADTVDELTECVPDANARENFRSFARLTRAA